MFDGGGVRGGSQAGDLGRLYMAVRYRQEGRAGVSRRGLGLASTSSRPPPAAAASQSVIVPNEVRTGPRNRCSERLRRHFCTPPGSSRRE